MLSLSEVYIFSARADVLVFKTYRYNVKSDIRSVFTRRLKDIKQGQLPPHFCESDITYYYIKRGGLYFVASSNQSVSAVLVIEFLCRLYHVCKDFCGVISEDSIKANILLVQEILDEILDMGYVQLATTEKLKPYIQSDPVMVRPSRSPSEDVAARLLGFENRVAPSSAADRPVALRNLADQNVGTVKNEIFVDVVERMTAVIGPHGKVTRLEINGSVNMKSFLAGNPSIKVAVNEDLVISADKASRGYGNEVQLDHCTFHPVVNMKEFDESRILIVQPPAGEFSLMTYTISGDLPSGVPFQVKVFVGEADQSRDTELVLKIKGGFPSNTHAVNVIIKIPVSKHVTGITQQLSGVDQSAELQSMRGQLVWRIKTFTGGWEHTGRFRLISQMGHKVQRKEIGPVAMEFEISGYTASGFHIRFLRVYDRKVGYVPYRWVRYITVSDSYLVKV